ncbi:hypothetical protein [Chryseolinea lacunae]|uniref:Cell surface protein SprA n=1 Tax=Chryseolinea lacunae TaxID=2801331 RepID=A0ABS1L1J7_9BACT|nr:hypothetical protein [Chryseolinea lacunae]MBL0744802.1 hypothetical protein [Chryseolinea lacunae]
MKRLRKHQRAIAAFLLAVMLSASIPTRTYALTSGPSQPEVQSFQPATASNMVDLFSGDFSYNIPLFELPGPNGGYPFNLSYQSGITMDSEASWVGLGFNLAPGAVTRQMRGLPDEFKGDKVYTKMSMKPSVTVGVATGANFELFGSEFLKGKLGLSVRQNNYKGFGYSIDGGLGFSNTNSDGMTTGLGVNFSLDSQEGVSVSPSLSLGTKAGSVGLGVSYNSKSGLGTLSTSYDVTLKTTKYAVADEKTKTEKNIKDRYRVSQAGGVGSEISFSHPGYTPQVTMPMRSINVSGQFQIGGAFAGAFASAYLSGYYNEQRLLHDKKRVPAPAYGYLHLQDVNSKDALMDVNREKEGMVTEVIPNLAIPSLSYDIYSFSGQGIASMVRPMRNDLGISRDPAGTSTSTSVSAGVDVGILTHVGVNLTVSHSTSKSGEWKDDNNLTSRFSFQPSNLDRGYEPYYFKAHGDPVAEPADSYIGLGGDRPVRVRLDGNTATQTLDAAISGSAGSLSAPSSTAFNTARRPRSQSTQFITNEQLLSNGAELMPPCGVTYFENTATTTQRYNRSQWPTHHTAAIAATTADGIRYIYALPAYNTVHEEVVFSTRKGEGISRVNAGNNGSGDPSYEHSKTDKFLKRAETPPYAYAHLLTSILGPDYVDVTGNGVTEDDLGYWVKFTYRRVATKQDPFRWRDPFSKAHYQEGWTTDPKDDRGSFVYGEKEIWYLAQAETKSHIATFHIEDRDDAKGAQQRLQDTNQRGKSVKALREIRLFSRFANGEPIKVCKFRYSYNLCPGTENSESGKLTLEELWFEYGKSARGRLNPYKFTYASVNVGYDVLAYDRWGTYKPYPAGKPATNYRFPYSLQDESQKSTIDANASAWNLAGIQLPSGGQIDIDYESDDYAYVQHRPAMQMMELVEPYGNAEQPQTASTFGLTGDPKIRFRLERPIDGNSDAKVQANEVKKYLDDKDQVFFKIAINLQEPAKDLFEYINAYANIDRSKPMGLEKGPSGKYEFGYLYLKKDKGYHPLMLRAWQHVRTNQPNLPDGDMELEASGSLGKQVSFMKALVVSILDLKDLFKAFYKNAENKNWGKEMLAGNCWLRLRSPDGIKYGGGLRVKQITIRDDWQGNEEGIYGQRYEYTMVEKGQTISSGVAAYEPFIGGEENPLRYAKEYTESIPLATDNNLFFEYPINEGVYPGAQVGYRLVTVMSLASASRAKRPLDRITLSDGKKLFPEGSDARFGTTGKTEHEFYTAKDFPVLAYETPKVNRHSKSFIPIPLLGSLAETSLTTSQGYSIITNDMHGKQKRVSQFRQAVDGTFDKDTMSYVAYNYYSKPLTYDKQAVNEVIGLFKDNGDGTVSTLDAAELKSTSIAKVTLGQETDFFTDMREYKDNTFEGGVRVNIDIIPAVFIPIPIPTAWPSIGKTSKRLRTVVTNKVIFKTGMLQSTTAYDGGSKLYTKTLRWDKFNGTAALQTVNNNFDKLIYSYSIPAYTQYQGMGAAYKTAGLAFSLRDVRNTKGQQYEFVPGFSADNLYAGDEMILYTDNLKTPVAFAVYLGDESGKPMLWTNTSLGSVTYNGMVVRSGYRNQLTVAAGNITALDDPTKRGTEKVYSKRITIPKIN